MSSREMTTNSLIIKWVCLKNSRNRISKPLKGKFRAICNPVSIGERMINSRMLGSCKLRRFGVQVSRATLSSLAHQHQRIIMHDNIPVVPHKAVAGVSE